MPSDDRLSNDPHSKTIVVSLKIPKNFRYFVPRFVSHYFDKVKVHTTATSLDVAAYLNEIYGQGNFRDTN